MNKEIAQAVHTERFVFQVFFVMCAVLGALFVLGWGIPWLSEQKSTVMVFLAPVIIVAYSLAFVLVGSKVFSKPKVDIDRSTEPEIK